MNLIKKMKRNFILKVLIVTKQVSYLVNPDWNISGHDHKEVFVFGNFEMVLNFKLHNENKRVFSNEF